MHELIQVSQIVLQRLSEKLTHCLQQRSHVFAILYVSYRCTFCRAAAVFLCVAFSHRVFLYAADHQRWYSPAPPSLVAGTIRSFLSKSATAVVPSCVRLTRVRLTRNGLVTWKNPQTVFNIYPFPNETADFAGGGIQSFAVIATHAENERRCTAAMTGIHLV